MILEHVTQHHLMDTASSWYTKYAGDCTVATYLCLVHTCTQRYHVPHS